jgi:hypothetical protein
VGRRIVDSGQVSMKIGIRLRSGRWDAILGRNDDEDALYVV